MDKDQSLWLIWSIEHNGWLIPSRHGYTQYKKLAGVFYTDEARQRIREMNMGSEDLPKESMIEFFK